MELHIDTTEQGVIRLELRQSQKLVARFRKQTRKISETLLPAIGQLQEA